MQPQLNPNTPRALRELETTRQAIDEARADLLTLPLEVRHYGAWQLLQTGEIDGLQALCLIVFGHIPSD